MKETVPPSARSTRSSAILQSLLSLILMTCILVMINYLGFKYYKHLDLSHDQLFTLSSQSVDVVQSLPANGVIYMFPIFNPATGQDDSGKEYQISNLAKEYARLSNTKLVFQQLGLDDTAKIEELKKVTQFTNAVSTVIIQVGQQAKALDASDLYESNPYDPSGSAPFKGEQVITSTLMALADSSKPKIYFTTGHGERLLKSQDPDQSCSYLEQYMRQDNLDPLDLNLSNMGDVPADAGAVVVMGPMTEFAPFEADALARYVKKNGHLVVMQDPRTKSGLEDLLAKYGLKFNDDVIVSHVPTNIGPSVIPLALISPDGISRHPVTAKFADAFMANQVILKMQNFRSLGFGFTGQKEVDAKTTFLMRTPGEEWNFGMSKPIPPDMTQDQLNAVVFDPKADTKAPLTVAAVYDQNFVPGGVQPSAEPGTKIVIFGGTSSFCNSGIKMEIEEANIFTNALDWMSKKNPVLSIKPKSPDQYILKVSPMQERTLDWISLFFIPATFLFLGILTWLSRRK